MSFFFGRRNESPSPSNAETVRPSNTDSNESQNIEEIPNEEDRAALLALYGGTGLGLGRDPNKAKYDFATDEELDKMKKKKEEDEITRENLCFFYSLQFSVIISLSFSLFGFDVGCMAGAIPFITADLSLSVEEEDVIMSALNFFAAIGAFVGWAVADYFGRRPTIICSSTLCLLGSICLSIALNFEFLVLGRILLGLGCGAAMMTGPMYISEIVPPRYRGKLVGVSDIFINLGIICGYLISFLIEEILNYDFNWRIMLGCGALPAILILCLIGLVPESPRWLILTYPDRLDYAQKSLHYVSKNSEDEQIIIKEIQRSIAMTEESRTKSDQQRNFAGGIFQGFQSMYHWMFSGEEYSEIPSDNNDHLNRNESNEGNEAETTADSIPQSSFHYIKHHSKYTTFAKYLNFSLLLAMGIALAQQITGAESLVYYAPEILLKAGVVKYSAAVGFSLFVGLSKVLGDFVGIVCIDVYGRRNMMILSSFFVFLSTLGIGLALLYELEWYYTLSFMCLYMFCFSIGLGVGTFLLCSELSPINDRAKTMAFSIAINRILTGVSIVIFLNITTNKSMGYAYTYVFSVGGGLALLYHYLFTPETMNLSLEEVQRRYFSIFKNGESPASLATGRNTTSDTEEGGENGNGDANENMALLP